MWSDVTLALVSAIVGVLGVFLRERSYRLGVITALLLIAAAAVYKSYDDNETKKVTRMALIALLSTSEPPLSFHDTMQDTILRLAVANGYANPQRISVKFQEKAVRAWIFGNTGADFRGASLIYIEYPDEIRRAYTVYINQGRLDRYLSSEIFGKPSGSPGNIFFGNILRSRIERSEDPITVKRFNELLETYADLFAKARIYCHLPRSESINYPGLVKSGSQYINQSDMLVGLVFDASSPRENVVYIAPGILAELRNVPDVQLNALIANAFLIKVRQYCPEPYLEPPD